MIPPRSYNIFHLKGLEKSDNFVVFQLHSHYFNVTIFVDEATEESKNQNGTNLGFVITNKTSQSVHVWNKNNDYVECLVAVIVYDALSPVPDRVMVRETSNFIIASVVEEESVDLSAYFTYLEVNIFTPEAYFEGIRRMMNTSMKEEFKVITTTTVSQEF